MPISGLNMTAMALEGESAAGSVDKICEKKEKEEGESIRARDIHRARTVKSLGYVSDHRSPF